jgi:DNA-binding transcriptional LysR family regulator
MEMRHLRTFTEVVRQGSFWRAAEELNLAQSTITLQVQQLERVLGVSLFERNGKRVTLTDLGQVFFEKADDLLAQASELRQSMRELASLETGRVCIGALEPTAGLRLPSIIARFCDQWPRVEATFRIGSSAQMSEDVSSGELDFAICALPSLRAGLKFDVLFIERMGLMVSKNHPLAERAIIDATELAKHRLLLPERTCPYREQIESELLRITGQRPMIVEIGSLDALLRTAQHGAGVAVLPDILCQEQNNEMVVRPIHGIDIDMHIGILRPSGKAKLRIEVQTLMHMIKTDLAVPDELQTPDKLLKREKASA